MRDEHYLSRELYERNARDPAIFEFLQSGSLDGVWYWDLENPEHEWISHRFWETFGYDPVEKKHLASEWQDMIHPDDLKTAVENFYRHCADPSHPYDQYVRYRHRDGSTVWVRCRGMAIRDANGKAIRMLGAHTDVTALKQAEEKATRLAAELDAANQELEAFSYSVSHDLRAPLRSIDGFSRIVQEDYAAKLDDEGRDSLARIRAAAQRMAQLIDDLLKLARVSRAGLDRQSVDLSGLARDVAAELRQQEPARAVEMVVKDGLTAQGDPRLLLVVLENLLGNAWKFTGRRERARIEFGAEAQNARVTYFVRDNGAGFDAAHAARLFGAFQRLHSNEEFAGTGIGLATVQRIIRRHGGSVWAEGTVDQGATFWFDLGTESKS